jgi:hypothetical protein
MSSNKHLIKGLVNLSDRNTFRSDDFLNLRIPLTVKYTNKQISEGAFGTALGSGRLRMSQDSVLVSAVSP